MAARICREISMKLLLDENLPHTLRKLLVGHEVYTTAYMKWRGKKNGALLRAAADAGFDAFISKDTKMPYQQNLDKLPCSLVVLYAESHAIVHIRPLIPELLEKLRVMKPCSLIRVGYKA